MQYCSYKKMSAFASGQNVLDAKMNLQLNLTVYTIISFYYYIKIAQQFTLEVPTAMLRLTFSTNVEN